MDSSTTVARLVSQNRPITIRPDDSLALAFQTMLWADVHHLPVVDGEALVGVLSERDILKRQAEVGSRAAGHELVKRAMSAPAITAKHDERLGTVTRRMLDCGIGCLPVVDRHKLVAVITRTDVLGGQIEPPAEEPAGDGPRASDVMNKQPATVAGDDALLDAIARMDNRGIRHLPVVDGDRHVVGMLSDRDVRTAIGDARRPLEITDAAVRLRSTKVAHCMSREPFTVREDVPVKALARHLLLQRIGAVPVVDDRERLVGIVSYIDVLRRLAV